MLALVMKFIIKKQNTTSLQASTGRSADGCSRDPLCQLHTVSSKGVHVRGGDVLAAKARQIAISAQDKPMTELRRNFAEHIHSAPKIIDEEHDKVWLCCRLGEHTREQGECGDNAHCVLDATQTNTDHKHTSELEHVLCGSEVDEEGPPL